MNVYDLGVKLKVKEFHELCTLWMAGYRMKKSALTEKK